MLQGSNEQFILTLQQVKLYHLTYLHTADWSQEVLYIKSFSIQ